MVQFKREEKQLVFTSQTGAARLPLCCNRRLFSERRTHARAVIERTWRRAGSGPEGSGPAGTQSFDVEWEGDRFVERKKFLLFGRRGIIQSFEPPWGSLSFSVRCVVECWLTTVCLAWWEKLLFSITAREEQQIQNQLVCYRGSRGKKKLLLPKERRLYTDEKHLKTGRKRTFTRSPTLKYHLNFTKACNSGPELFASSVLFSQKRSILLISLPQTASFQQSR